jgi:hypothetical protein
LVSAILSFAWSTLAWSQPSDSERETARSLMDEGDRLTSAADLQGALKRYLAAHEIMGVPTTGIEVARTQEKLGLLVEARAVAIEVANSVAAPREPSVFADARTEAGKLAERLEARIPSVVVTVTPGGLPEVFAKIEETKLPQAAIGLPVKVNPGKHVLDVAAPGYLSESVPFTVVEGEQRNLVVSLTQAPVQQSTQPNVPVRQEPTGPAEQPADASPTRSRTATYVAFGVAGAAALVGGGAGVYSLMKTNEAKDKYCSGNSCTEQARELTADANTLAWVANIGLGVAVLAAGYGTYTLLSAEDESETARHRGSVNPTVAVGIVPSPWFDGAAVSCSGAF